MPKQIKIIIGLIILLFIYSFVKMLYNTTTSFYNTEKSYQLEYKQVEQDQLTTFDNNYLIFKEKSNIAELNKETFITVTEIIMSNRKDGQNIAWKWVHENQQFDYNEFTKFYSDLSNFTSERYKENNSMERRKQEMAKQHNFLIQTFPGVIYNQFFKFNQLEYKEGFVTDETKALFGK
jgi:hypothetical protein